MSLFGDESTETLPQNSSLNSKSLFGDQVTPAATSSSSLFADDGGDASPWDMPTPKKAARKNMIKNLLPATEVPESYIDAFDAIINSNDRSGSGIDLTGVKRVLSSSGISTGDQETILNLVIPEGQEPTAGLGRSEFNVLLALVGLAQEGDEVTLDGVDDRRRRLPQPKVSYIDKLQTQAAQRVASPPPTPSPQQTSSRPVRKARQDSLDPSSDPWASPTNSRAPPPSTAAHTTPTNGLPTGFIGSGSNGVTSGTTTFHSRSDQPAESGPPNGNAPSTGGAWGSYNASTGGGFSEAPTIGGGGFSESGGDSSGRSNHNPQRSVSGVIGGVPAQGTGETIIITMLPEKEGMFLFQHHNYEVKSFRRGSSVIRRYSDFVWLLDCLQKRYPFRRLPLLPPKRVQVNGTHLAGDAASFLEKRRRGLVRFANQLIQHPILSQEQLVVMFLTVPTELAVWRKQATISVQEEFVGKALPPTLEDSLPSTLPALFDQVRIGVKQSCEIYINLCALLERLAKRNEGLAADSLRFSLALQNLTESSADTYAIDTNDVPLLNEGINATAKHLSNAQALLEDEAKAWDTLTLEDFKKQRDALLSMRDMFDRRDRLARDNIPTLERRIEASEGKLQQLRMKPQAAVKPGEIEKVESSIIADKESIVQQHARGVFIKECVRDEIVTFQSTIYNVSKLHQDWSQERVKYTELQSSNWRGLVDEVESMPVGE